MNIPLLRRLLPCLLPSTLALLPLLAAAQVVAIADDVLVDRSGGTVLLRADDGALRAVETATGATAWENVSLARPVGLHQSTLVAQRSDPPTVGVLALALADASSGELLLPVDVPIAGSVTPLLQDGPAARFELYVVLAGPVMTIEWVWHRSPLRGARLSSAEEGVAVRANEREFGRFELDLASGMVTPVPIAEPLERPLRFEEVTEIPDAPGRQFAEPSGTLILASELDAPETWDRYAWRVYDVGGVLLGGLRSPWSLAPYSVSGNAVLVIEPPHTRLDGAKRVSHDLSLVGHDLDSGAVLWRVPLRDRTYRGPLPG